MIGLLKCVELFRNWRISDNNIMKKDMPHYKYDVQGSSGLLYFIVLLLLFYVINVRGT